MYRTLRLLARAGIQNIWSPSSKLTLSAMVVSPGGVGTTTVMEHISQFCTINDPYDADKLKHLPRPPKWVVDNASMPVLFVTGDTDDIVRSLKRRGWNRIQAARLASPLGVIAPAEMSDRSLIKSIHQQQNQWERIPSHRFKLIDYNDIWSSAAVLAKHFRIDDERFIRQFPKKRKRKSVSPDSEK
ncbi:MAG: hypothetical protein AAF664_14435 [Planctomycetota bacterium]